jgi:hypothetical protein
MLTAVAGPSTSRALTELEQIEVLNEVLDNETINEYCDMLSGRLN